jgi:DNA mismatch repair ATPase MutL
MSSRGNDLKECVSKENSTEKGEENRSPPEAQNRKRKQSIKSGNNNSNHINNNNINNKQNIPNPSPPSPVSSTRKKNKRNNNNNNNSNNSNNSNVDQEMVNSENNSIDGGCSDLGGPVSGIKPLAELVHLRTERCIYTDARRIFTNENETRNVDPSWVAQMIIKMKTHGFVCTTPLTVMSRYKSETTILVAENEVDKVEGNLPVSVPIGFTLDSDRNKFYVIVDGHHRYQAFMELQSQEKPFFDHWLKMW